MVKAKSKRNMALVSDGDPQQESERQRIRADPRVNNPPPDSKNGAKRRNKTSTHAGDKAASNKTARRRKPTSEKSKKGSKAPNPEAHAALSDICQNSPE